MLQVPVPLVIVTVVPLIEQAPVAPKVTARPEVDEPVTVNVAPKAAVAGAPVNVIVCVVLLAVVLLLTCVAAL